MEKYGLSDEDLRDVAGTATAGGVKRIWETWQALVSRRQEEVIADFDVERKAQEETPAGSDRCADDPMLWATARASWEDRRSRELEKLESLRSGPVPMWRMISGLDGEEFLLSPGERAGRIRKLLKGVERVARAELRAEETRCHGDRRGLLNKESDGDGERDGRCYAWDPLRSICFYFGIAKTKLGAYAWEVWGLSAPQLVDRVKCEAVKGKVRAEMKEFLLAYGAEHAGAEFEAAWAAWRAARKGLSQRTALAARLGFSSYSRYFRACVLCYGVEGEGLEREVMGEVWEMGEKGEGEEPGAVVKRGEVRITKDEVREEKREDGLPGHAAG